MSHLDYRSRWSLGASPSDNVDCCPPARRQCGRGVGPSCRRVRRSQQVGTGSATSRRVHTL
eukprot:4812691-Prymnesium_polylepis.2